MTLAILATFLGGQVENFKLLIPLMLGGALIGAILAKRVEMTSMPELVAILHSFVGLAAVLVGMASFLDPGHTDLVGAEKLIHEIEILLGVFIGGVTFTGSVIAFGKLRGSLSGKPLLLPGRHFLNLGMVGVAIWLGAEFLQQGPEEAWITLLIVTAISLVLGIHPDRSHRGCGHAGGGFHAEQLFGMGGGGGRFHAEKRFADHYRSLGGQ